MNTTSATEKRNGTLGKWHPKKWKPDYERIVGLSCIGKMNKEIAEMTGYTPEHVSTILNLPEADELRSLILTRMRQITVEDVSVVLGRVGYKTAKLLDNAMSNKDLIDNPKSLFALIDRGLDVLKGVGSLRLDEKNRPSGVNVERGVILTGESAERFVEGMQKANKAKEIHGNLSLVRGDGKAVGE